MPWNWIGKEAVQRFCEEHGFEPTEPLPSGHCSEVWADSTRVLKLPFRGEEMVSGLGATVALARVGGPKVFAVDATIPAMLMERLVPGTKLLSSELSDLEQLEVMALGMITFRTLPWAGCLGLSDFFLRESALKDHLLSTTDEQCFLHGDYHQDNVLWDGVNWRPIDPKGLVGDPHLEPVAFLRNPLESVQDRPDLLEFTRDRIVAFAERLGLDPWRIAAWSAISERDEDGDTPLALVCDALMEWFGE